MSKVSHQCVYIYVAITATVIVAYWLLAMMGIDLKTTCLVIEKNCLGQDCQIILTHHSYHNCQYQQTWPKDSAWVQNLTVSNATINCYAAIFADQRSKTCVHPFYDQHGPALLVFGGLISVVPWIVGGCLWVILASPNKFFRAGQNNEKITTAITQIAYVQPTNHYGQPINYYVQPTHYVQSVNGSANGSAFVENRPCNSIYAELYQV